MKTKTTIALTVLVLAAGGLYWSLASGEPSGPTAADAAAGSMTRLERAPDVRFASLEGDSASLADYRGEVVLLNFWATWCHPCRREIPDLVKVQEELEGRKATVVGLAVDSGSEEEIRSFASELGVNYPLWTGRTRAVVEHFRIVGFPTTLLVDREGRVQKRYMGPQTAETFLPDVEALL